MDKKLKQWLLKAESDLKVAINELSFESPVTDVICFHCQQAVEKFLKAYLVSKGISFGKTHNITFLLKLCIESDKDFIEIEKMDVEKLTIYATELRYPDFFYIPPVEEAEEAVKKAKFVREFVMGKIEGGRDV